MPLRLRNSERSMSVALPVQIPKDPPGSKLLSDTDDDNSSDDYEFFNPAHPRQVLTCFNELRKNGVFTDVILSADDMEFPCHRAILVAGSKYFRAMFTNDHRESREMLVQINGMQSHVMNWILEYLYTSKVTITTDNVQLLLEASNLFQITPLTEASTKFLEAQLDPCNCIGMREFAAAHCLSILYSKATDMINEKFASVVEFEEFTTLPKNRVIDYISDDDINVAREEIVYEAVKRWVAHDPITRSKDFAELLSYVRIPLIHPSYFVNVIECDEQVFTNRACQPILQETRKYHILGNEIYSARTRPRKSTGCSAAIVVVGGVDRIGGYNMPYVEAFDPASGNWTSLARLPTFTKSEYAVTSFRNSIIVSGGRSTGHSRDVWLYQSHLDNWVKVASLKKGRWRHRMITMGGHVYCIGGYDGKNKLKSVERYDSYSNTWEACADLLSPVTTCAVATCLGKLYVIGGGSQDECTEKVQMYDSEQDMWVYKTRLPYPVKRLAAASTLGKIFVIGMERGFIHAYDPILDEWTDTNVGHGRFDSCGVAVCGGMLYITGGVNDDSGEACDDVMRFEPITGKISRISSMPRPCCYHGCVTIHRFNKTSGDSNGANTNLPMTSKQLLSTFF